jgi:hypothetical protein
MEDGIVFALLGQDEGSGGASGLEGSGHSEDARVPSGEPGTADYEGTAGWFEAKVWLGEAVDDVATGEPLTEVGDVRLRLLGLGVGGRRRRRRREEVVGGGVGGIDKHGGLVREDCGCCRERIARSR